jgi:hypothetical protein
MLEHIVPDLVGRLGDVHCEHDEIVLLKLLVEALE